MTSRVLLLKKAREGNKEAENELFHDLLVSFRVIARHKIRDYDIADEIAQKSCVTALEKYKREQFLVGFDAWAHGILNMNMKNFICCAGKTRTSSIDRDIKGGKRDQIISNSDPDVSIQVNGCFRKIIKANPRYARILALIYQGYKVDELCEKFGITRNNFYVTLNRARAMLWECLKGER